MANVTQGTGNALALLGMVALPLLVIFAVYQSAQKAKGAEDEQ